MKLVKLNTKCYTTETQKNYNVYGNESQIGINSIVHKQQLTFKIKVERMNLKEAQDFSKHRGKKVFGGKDHCLQGKMNSRIKKAFFPSMLCHIGIPFSSIQGLTSN